MPFAAQSTLTRRSAWAVDIALTVLVAAIMLLDVLSPGWISTGRLREFDALAAILLCALIAPLLFRRRQPVAVLLVMWSASVFYSLLGYPPIYGIGVGTLIALYTAAYEVSRRWAYMLGTYAAVTWPIVVIVQDPTWKERVLDSTLFVVAWFLGRSSRAQRDRAIDAHERATRAEVEQEESARRAVAVEQARIGREIHDIVAHNISMIVLQASGAQQVLDRDTEQARAAMGVVERTGRQALDDLRRLLRAVRGHGRDALAPQPGIAHIDTLLADARQAGVPARLVVEGIPVELPTAMDLSIYRIVQEALTNVVKHAGPASATVSLCYTPTSLEVKVADDGLGGGRRDDSIPSGGHGHTGMRERVVMFGGELQLGPLPAGGYAVRARFPLQRVTT